MKSTRPRFLDDPMPPPGPAPLPIADLVRDLVRSRVLAADRAQDLFGQAPLAVKWDSVLFAQHLVDRGELTPFQAEKLLRGHWRGLALGPYRILSPLGRGGMGIVYLARSDSPAQEIVALKVLPPQRAAAEPRMLARFQRERDIGLTLPPHPHLTRTLEGGELAGVHYLAMEYVPGQTVRQRVTSEGPLADGAAARIFADVAAGLGIAHEAGFIHRDLKPANIIVQPSGRAKLLDFGFALIRGETAPADPTVIGGPGYALGTMDYLAPEQAVDPVGVGPAADLYSLGCSLYFAVTGSPPFPNGTPQDKIRWHRTAIPAPVRQLNPLVSPELATIIERLMIKDPTARPATSREILARLAPLADPIPATPVVAEPSNRTGELLRLAEESWQTVAAATTCDESLVLIEDPSPEPVTRVQLSYGVVCGVVVGAIMMLAAAMALGWRLARG